MRRAIITSMILLPAMIFAGCGRSPQDRNATGTATLNRLAATITGATVAEATFGVHGPGAQTPYVTLGLQTASTDKAAVNSILHQGVQAVADTLAAEKEGHAYVTVWVRDSAAAAESPAIAGLDSLYATPETLQTWLEQHPR